MKSLQPMVKGDFAMKKFLGLILPIIVLVFVNSSCSLSMKKMILVFDSWVAETVGRNLDELKYSKTQAFIGKREPIEIRELETGNLLYVYDYWKGTAIKRDGDCKVFLEFDLETMIVLAARSEGKGCYTAY